MDQAVFHEAVGRIIWRFRPGRPVDLVDVLTLSVLEQRAAHRPGIADERDAVGPDADDLAAADASRGG